MINQKLNQIKVKNRKENIKYIISKEKILMKKKIQIQIQMIKKMI